MKRILITGISGFVGSGLCEYFRGKDEYELYGYSRDEHRAAELNSKFNVKFIKEFTTEVLNEKQIDTIVHLAGIAHDLSGKFKEEDYRKANYEFTRKIYDEYNKSNSEYFVFVSSVKAVIDQTDEIITEDVIPRPKSPYGKSKLEAEQYISIHQTESKKNIILRPCMIHGPGNKGNLNLLYKFVRSGIPYPFTAFENSRSFLSLENFCFVIEKIITGAVDPGIYMLSDKDPKSTNQLIELIGNVQNKKVIKLRIPKSLIRILAKIGSLLNLPFNTNTLNKLCGNMVVSNKKLIANLKKELPVSATEGLIKTIRSFNE